MRVIMSALLGFAALWPALGSAQAVQSDPSPGVLVPWWTVETKSAGGIKSAEGSFISVTGVNSIASKDTDTFGQGSGALYNGYYSLQLNTNNFPVQKGVASCNPTSGSTCTGWVQFAYQAPGGLFIEYWLKGSNTCPAGWTIPYSGACYYNSYGNASGDLPFIGSTDQGTLRGQTVNGQDTVILTAGGKSYSATASNPFGSSWSSAWNRAEFNVLGNGNGHYQAVFNSGSSLIVNLKIDDGTTNAPTCFSGGITAEWNNLYVNSPCCAYDGGQPSIAFVEGSTNSMTSYPKCDSLGYNTITSSVASGGGGTISPSVALKVPSKAISTLTATPNSGYKVASITGTGAGCATGKFDSSTNTFTTGPASGNCTVTATFTPTVTYTVTSSVSTGSSTGTISPLGTSTANPGITKTFTLAPSSGYVTSSVGGTCGGTLSGNTYTTKAITANCTVVAAFAQQMEIVSVGAVTGGTINPAAGLYSVPVNTTKQFILAPNSGYIPSVGGTCGGTLLSSGNNTYTYTTKPIVAICSVITTFAQPTVKLNSITPSGTSSPAVGTAVSVAAGGTVQYTVTPPLGASSATWSWDAGCSTISLASTWYIGSSLALKVGPVTSNCTFQTTFTVSNFTVTVSQATGGTITPGTVSVKPGATQAFTSTANAGYNFVNVSTTCGVNGSWSNLKVNASNTAYVSGTYTVPITGNCTITPIFAKAS